MYKHFLIALAIVVVTGVGLYATSASALTADEIQSQIARLQQQIGELTAQLVRLRGGNASETTPGNVVPGKHRICQLLSRNLDRGAEGDDVRSLQEFLYENKLLAVAPTGYFGEMTAAAVRKWQSNEGVMAVGAFGPLSRERLKMWCGGNASGVLSAVPQKGDAPLSVTFTSTVGDGTTRPSAYDGQDTVLDFGDGSEVQWISCGDEANAMQQRCSNPVSLSHTYATNGTYVATLKKTGGFCAGQCPETVIAQVRIVVGASAPVCTKEYRPVCGAKPIVCIKAPCNPIPTTYGNRCEMNADGATLLYEGECRSASENPADDPQCKTWFDGCNSCARSTPGGPGACTLRYCFAPGKAYCTARF